MWHWSRPPHGSSSPVHGLVPSCFSDMRRRESGTIDVRMPLSNRCALAALRFGCFRHRRYGLVCLLFGETRMKQQYRTVEREQNQEQGNQVTDKADWR